MGSSMHSTPDHEKLVLEAIALQREADRLADGGFYLQARFKRDEAKALLPQAERLKAASQPSK
jgi:hypothetical protein